MAILFLTVICRTLFPHEGSNYALAASAYCYCQTLGTGRRESYCGRPTSHETAATSDQPFTNAPTRSFSGRSILSWLLVVLPQSLPHSPVRDYHHLFNPAEIPQIVEKVQISVAIFTAQEGKAAAQRSIGGRMQSYFRRPPTGWECRGPSRSTWT